MRKITFPIIIFLVLPFLQKSYCLADSLPDRFKTVVQSLESYAKQQGIKLGSNENIKDVVTLSFIKVINRLKVSFTRTRRIKMRKITFLITIFLVLLFLQKSYCLAESLPDRFKTIVQSLESYAKQQGIKLGSNENIKDVVTLGYINAINKLKVPFGTNDDRVKNATVEWLSILCWFPIVPPEKKKKDESELKQIRFILSQNLYKRTLATISLLPGFVVYDIQFVNDYTFSEMGAQIYNNRDQPEYIANIANSLIENKITYDDLIKLEWIDKYLSEQNQ